MGGFLLAIITLGIYYLYWYYVLNPVEIPYAQSHVNKVWRLEAEEGAKRDLGMRGVAPAT